MDQRRAVRKADNAAAFRALLMRNGAHLRKQPRLPRMQHPTRIALRYFTRLRRGPLADLRETIDGATPRLRAAFERGASAHRIDAAEDEIDGILDELREKFFADWSRDEFARLVQPIISDTSVFHAGQLNKTLYPMIGVDVIGNEPHLAPVLEAAVRENVALIKSIASVHFDQIEKILTREIATGSRWEDMAEQIVERFGVTESRANLIARDQTGKLYGRLNAIRQTDLGISGYIWRTMQDNRVREEHADREGDEYQWTKPPADGNPGEPIQCRCFGEPDLRPILAEARGER